MVEIDISNKVMQAGLIDLDATFFIQLALFLLLYSVLWATFFGPYTRFLRRRDEASEGLKKKAADLQLRTEEIEKELEQRLSEARSDAIQVRRELAEEGKRLRAEIVERERRRMQAELEKHLAELDGEKRKILAELDAVSADIAGVVEEQLRAVEGKTR